MKECQINNSNLLVVLFLADSYQSLYFLQVPKHTVLPPTLEEYSSDNGTLLSNGRAHPQSFKLHELSNVGEARNDELIRRVSQDNRFVEASESVSDSEETSDSEDIDIYDINTGWLNLNRTGFAEQMFFLDQQVRKIYPTLYFIQ